MKSRDSADFKNGIKFYNRTFFDHVWDHFVAVFQQKDSALALSLLGFQTIADFVAPDGNLVRPQDAVAGGVPRVLWIEWAKATAAIRRSGGSGGHSGSFTPLQGTVPRTCNKISICTGQGELSNENLKVGKILGFTKTYRPHPESKVVTKWCCTLNVTLEDLESRWKTIGKLSICGRTRSFHVRLLNGLLYGNKDFFIFGHRESPGCNWCGHIEQTSVHLYAECPLVQDLRSQLTHRSPDLVFSTKDWVLGNNSPSFSYIALCFAQYISDCNHFELWPAIQEFEERIKLFRRTEFSIARKKNKIAFCAKKWDAISSILHI